MIAKQILFFKDTKKCDPHSNNELNEKELFSVNAMGHEISVTRTATK
jgi:hypothetical protein